MSSTDDQDLRGVDAEPSSPGGALATREGGQAPPDPAEFDASLRAGRRRLAIIGGAMLALLALVVVLGLVSTAVAIVVGVGAAALYFIAANKAIDRFAETTQERVRPWVFVAPALLFLAAFLVVPAVRTVWISLFDRTGDDFVGLENYGWVLTDGAMRTVFRNNVLWLVGVTAVSTALGLLLAVLADKVKRESLVKSLIFLPMAISFVGASVIWRFVYAFQPAGEEQIGILNAVWTALGNDPSNWLRMEPWNNLMLIVVMIWMQTGFAMVLLSAAIKGVPGELLEAARIDGANEWQVFRRITVPSIAGTLGVVVTTTIILVLKVFDIVRVMTSGDFNTNVIANAMIEQSFALRNPHQGATLAVILFLVVIPVLVVNIRRFRREEAVR